MSAERASDMFVVGAVEWDGSPAGGGHTMSEASMLRSASERRSCETPSWRARLQEADGGFLQVQSEFRERPASNLSGRQSGVQPVQAVDLERGKRRRRRLIPAAAVGDMEESARLFAPV